MHTSVCVCVYIGGDAYKFGGGMHTSVCVFMCWSMLVGTLSVIRLEYSVSELNMMKKKKKNYNVCGSGFIRESFIGIVETM